MDKRLTIVVPVLDEAAGIAESLQALAPLRAQGVEVIVVDGGSRDGTAALCGARADAVLSAPRGRARQMNAGARAARGEVLLFLHADTRLPDGAVAALLDGLRVEPAQLGPLRRGDRGSLDVVRADRVR